VVDRKVGSFAVVVGGNSTANHRGRASVKAIPWAVAQVKPRARLPPAGVSRASRGEIEIIELYADTAGSKKEHAV